MFTALGDPVNVAARLQDMTKSLKCQVIISEQVCKTAGIESDALGRTHVAIRGRDEGIAIRMAVDSTILTTLLNVQSSSAAAEG